MVEEVLANLRRIYFYVMVVRSAPAAGEFSRISSSFVYESSPTKVSALELFEVSDTLQRGQEGNEDVCAAVRRLKETFATDSAIPGLVTSLQEESTERLQFLSVADAVLRNITPVFEVINRSYSEATLVDRDVNPKISTNFMGMGSGQTWRGTPDGRADFTAVSIIRGNRLEESESESEQSAGGKTVCEAKQMFTGVDIDQLVCTGCCVFLYPQE